VGVKKLKSLLSPLTLPEGLERLPEPLLLYREGDQTLVPNAEFVRAFGAGSLDRIRNAKAIGLVRERPVHLRALHTAGRQEGFILENDSGERIPVDLKVSSLSSEGGGTWLVLFENTSVRSELQKKLVENHLELQKSYDRLGSLQQALIQSAKLASLGELSSGIAHELNQPLQAILGFSQELKHMNAVQGTGGEFLDDIISASRKMAEIIRSLRTFARDSGEELHPASVAHAIEESARLLRHSLLQSGVELRLEIEPELPLTRANPIQLEQVFVNLISNARDALEGSSAPDPRIRIVARNIGETIEVRVEDNGSGMSEEVRRKIFDPFFTTKPVGKGTGLGLSITHGILARAGAGISVRSEPGRGTEFIIQFPIEPSQTRGETA
jgi:C4-dicarboxylate-specific signal transduction histidine kinase